MSIAPKNRNSSPGRDGSIGRDPLPNVTRAPGALAGPYAIVGPGRMGTFLGRLLEQKGMTLRGYAGRDSSAKPSAGRIGRSAADETGPVLNAPLSTIAELAASGVVVWLLTVPDAELETVAARLAGTYASGDPTARLTNPMEGLVVLHTSGATSIRILDPCRQLGATSLCLHPLQTITKTADPGSLKGAAAAVTSDTAAGLEFGRALAERLGSIPFHLADEDKPLYHAAAATASNYVVTLAGLAEALAQAANLPREDALDALLPLMRGALDNLERSGVGGALTGPVARGDTETVRLHLGALAEAGHRAQDDRSEALPGDCLLQSGIDASRLYRELALATADLAERHGHLTGDRSEELRRLLNEESKTRRST